MSHLIKLLLINYSIINIVNINNTFYITYYRYHDKNREERKKILIINVCTRTVKHKILKRQDKYRIFQKKIDVNCLT